MGASISSHILYQFLAGGVLYLFQTQTMALALMNSIQIVCLFLQYSGHPNEDIYNKCCLPDRCIAACCRRAIRNKLKAQISRNVSNSLQQQQVTMEPSSDDDEDLSGKE